MSSFKFICKACGDTIYFSRETLSGTFKCENCGCVQQKDLRK